MDGDDPICFRRFKPREYSDPNPPMKWYSFQNDLSIG